MSGDRSAFNMTSDMVGGPPHIAPLRKMALSGVDAPSLALSRAAAVCNVDIVRARLDDGGRGLAGAMLLWHEWAAGDDAAQLSHVAQRVRDDALPIILSVPLTAIDDAVALFDDDRTILVSNPDAAQCAAVISAKLREVGGTVHTREGEAQDAQITLLQEEVGRISRMLARLTGDGALTPPPPSPFIEGQMRSPARDWTAGAQHSPAPVAPHQIRQIIRERRLRDEYFVGELFADPAWDMLLDLYAARLEHMRVSVSSLCIAAAVPATTALRWIRTMTEAGILERTEDPHDGRRIHVALSAHSAAAMHQYFARVAAEQRL
ncbi:MAG: winged helix DNA-binding protein [Sphingomonadaceae bacterium]|nr:winged helix DNA-binding protein [Sphingomonadaceae bacterium]